MNNQQLLCVCCSSCVLCIFSDTSCAASTFAGVYMGGVCICVALHVLSVVDMASIVCVGASYM